MVTSFIDISDLSSNPELAAMSTLHVAAVNGDKSTVELLLKKCQPEDYKCDVNEGDKYGRTALVYTIFGGWYDCAELLLRYGATVNKRDRDNRTSLHWAAYLGKPKFIKLFLRQMGKDEDWDSADEADLDGRTPLHYATAHQNSKCLRLLLERVLPGKVDVVDGEKKTALHWSAYYGNLEHVKLLLRRDAKINLRDAKCNTLLHLAVTNTSKDSVRIVRLLLKQNQYLAKQKDSEGRTPLHLAVANKNEEAVKELSTAEQCKLDEVDNLSRSALHYAVLNNNVDIVDILISRGASLYKADDKGATALHYAAKSNNTELVTCLISFPGFEDTPDKQGRTALMWAASEGSTDVLALMLRNTTNFNVHTRDNEDLSALHFASIAGNVDCVMLLIARSADISLRDKLGQTPLFKACQQGHLDVVDILMADKIKAFGGVPGVRGQDGCTVNLKDNQDYNENERDKKEYNKTKLNDDKNDCIVHVENRKGCMGKVGGQNGSNPNQEDCKGAKGSGSHQKGCYSNLENQNESSGKCEYYRGSDEILEYQDGSNQNIEDEKTCVRKMKETMGCYRGRENLNDCIRNLEDLNGCTPLHFAAHAGHVHVCEWLLHNGVDPGKKDSSGRIALHSAAFNGHTNCMALLLSHRPELVNDLDEDGNCALHRAATNGHLEAVKMLVLTCDAFRNYRVKSSNLTPLDCAIAGDHQDVTQFLIDHGALTIAGVQEVASNTIKRYIRAWIKRKKLSKLKPLLEKHEMLTKEESLRQSQSVSGTIDEEIDGNSSLGEQQGFHDKTQALQEEFACSSLDVHRADRAGTETYDALIIDQKLGKRPENVDVRYTPLIPSGTINNETRLTEDRSVLASYDTRCADEGEPLQFLIDMTENLPSNDDSNQTSLFEACRQGHLDVMNFLLTNDAEVNSRDEKGSTPMHVAALQGHEAVCRWLIENGADPEKRDLQGQTPLHNASLNGNTKCVQLLLTEKPGLLNYLDCDGRRALHCAASNGHLEVVTLLTLSYNAQPNFRIKSTNLTALDCAIAGNHKDVMQFMTEHQAATASTLENAANVIKRNLRARMGRTSPQSSTQRDVINPDKYNETLNKPEEPDMNVCCVDRTVGGPVIINKTRSMIEAGSGSNCSDGLVSAIRDHFEYLPEPPQERNRKRNVCQTVLEKLSRAPDGVVVTSEKERIFKLRRDWERIAVVRRKIQAAVVIQRYFRRHLQRKGVKCDTGRSSNQTTKAQSNNPSIAIKVNKKPPQSKTDRKKVANRLPTKTYNRAFWEQATVSEEKPKRKSCFPSLLESTPVSPLLPSDARGKVGDSPRKQGLDVSYRSHLTTNEIVEQWLDKGVKKSAADSTGTTSHGENMRRTRNVNVPKSNASGARFAKSYSFPQSSPDCWTTVPSTSTRTGKCSRSKSLQHTPVGGPMSSGQRQLRRKSLIKSVYSSSAAISYNFALDTYHPLVSRRGCKQAAFPRSTSTRVRPNSMKRGINGWIHTTEFAQQTSPSESSYDSR